MVATRSVKLEVVYIFKIGDHTTLNIRVVRLKRGNALYETASAFVVATVTKRDDNPRKKELNAGYPEHFVPCHFLVAVPQESSLF